MSGQNSVLITAMRDAMMGDIMVQRDVYLGRLSSLRPDTTMASLRANVFKATRMQAAGLCAVTIGSQSYVVVGYELDIVFEFEKAMYAVSQVAKQRLAQAQLDAALEAVTKAQDELAQAEARAKAVGL